MTTIVAFTAEQVCGLTALSPRQLAYWDKTGFFKPQRVDVRPGVPFGRVYSFRDVVGLRVISRLRNERRVPLQRLRAVGAWLAARYEQPWSTIRIFISGEGPSAEIAYEEPTSGAVIEATRRKQTVMRVALDQVEAEMDRRAEELKQRRNDEIGKITRNRYVAHNEYVLAGTRIATRAVFEYASEGFDTRRIIEQFPSLHPRDVRAALAFERNRRHRAS